MHPPPISSGRKACPRRRTRGFTAIELMVTIGIAAILAALAAPSFTGLMERWRVRQATEGLKDTLYYARSEAIKRGGNVVIQKSGNANGCTTSSVDDWDCGWIVCNDTNGNGTCNSSEPVLQRFLSPQNVEVTRPSASGNAKIELDRWGTVAGTFVGFSLVPKGATTSNPAARGVCMSSGGRVRITSNPPCDSQNP